MKIRSDALPGKFNPCGYISPTLNNIFFLLWKQMKIIHCKTLIFSSKNINLLPELLGVRLNIITVIRGTLILEVCPTVACSVSDICFSVAKLLALIL